MLSTSITYSQFLNHVFPPIPRWILCASLLFAMLNPPNALSQSVVMKPQFKANQSFELYLKQINHNRVEEETEDFADQEPFQEYGDYDFPEQNPSPFSVADFYDSFAAKGTLKVVKVTKHQTVFSYQRTRHNVGFILGDLIMQTTGSFDREEAQSLMDKFLENSQIHFTLDHKPGALPQLLNDSLVIQQYLARLNQLVEDINQQQIQPALELIEQMSEAMMENNRPDLLIYYPKLTHVVAEIQNEPQNEIIDFMQSYVYTMIDIFKAYQQVTLSRPDRFIYTIYPELALFFHFHHHSIQINTVHPIRLPLGNFTHAYYSGMHHLSQWNETQSEIEILTHWYLDPSQKMYFKDNLLSLLQTTYENLLSSYDLHFRVDPMAEFGNRPMDAKGKMTVTLDPQSLITQHAHREIEALTLDGNIHVSLILLVM